MNPYQEIVKTKHKNLTAAQLMLQETFVRLGASKRYDSISVTCLCSQAGVARTTFYANYANTDELLEEIENLLIEKLLQVNPFSSKEVDLEVFEVKYMHNVAEFVEDNRRTLEVMLLKQPDARLMNKWKMAVKYHFYDAIREKVGDGQCELALELMASLILSLYTWYLEHPIEFDIKQMAATVNSVIQTM